MTTTTKPTNYAAVQVETRTVYGIGRTADQARDDASEWFDHPDHLHVTTITPAAAVHVIKHGGAPCAELSFDRNGICMADEV